MDAAADPGRCPLCGGMDARAFAEAHERRYLRCAACLLTWMAAEDRLDPAAERAHYDWHENDPSDPGYRSFLGRLADPLLSRLPPQSRGLDYGSGPGPTLSVMLEEAGHRMSIWDPFYAPDPVALEQRYDFITVTETVEHFHAPGREFERIAGLVRRDGLIGIMTEPLTDDARFSQWWYVRDPTHVAFYREETLEWIARRFGWRTERISRTVSLLSAG